MQSRVERAILRGRVGGSLRMPDAGDDQPRFRGLVLPDGRDQLKLVDVADAKARPAAARHRIRRALLRMATIVLMAILALMFTARAEAWNF
jgi:hypothetical protein